MSLTKTEVIHATYKLKNTYANWFEAKEAISRILGKLGRDRVAQLKLQQRALYIFEIECLIKQRNKLNTHIN